MQCVLCPLLATELEHVWQSNQGWWVESHSRRGGIDISISREPSKQQCLNGSSVRMEMISHRYRRMNTALSPSHVWSTMYADFELCAYIPNRFEAKAKCEMLPKNGHGTVPNWGVLRRWTESRTADSGVQFWLPEFTVTAFSTERSWRSRTFLSDTAPRESEIESVRFEVYTVFFKHIADRKSAFLLSIGTHHYGHAYYDYNIATPTLMSIHHTYVNLRALISK